MSTSRRTIPILPIPSLPGVEAAHKVQARATQGRFTRWRWASLLATQLFDPIADLFKFATISIEALAIGLLASGALLILLERLKPHWSKRLLA